MKLYSYTHLLLCSSLLLPVQLLAAEQPTMEALPSSFIFDEHMSPHAASSLLMSTRTGLSRAEDWLWQPDWWGARLVSSFSNNIANDLLMLTSHEAAGHGFRFRSLLGYDGVKKYGLRFSGELPLLSWMESPLPALGASTAPKLKRPFFQRPLSSIMIRGRAQKR